MLDDTNRETVRIPLALRIDDRELSRIVTRAADVLAVVDDRGRVLEMNRQGQLILGYAPEEVPLLSIFAIDPDLDAAQLRELRHQVEGGGCITIERRLRCKDGSSMPVEIRMGIIKIDALVKVLLVAARDITERKRTEEFLLAASAEGITTSRMKSAFRKNSSYEIRAPLSAIAGYTSLVADLACQASDDNRFAALKGIERATRRLLETIQSTIDLSSVESQTFGVRPKVLDLAGSVETEVGLFRQDAAKKGLTLVWDPHACRPRVRFDRYCLSRAVRKLIDNAIKFTDDGRIEVRIGRDAVGEIVLEVRDTGVGISEGYMSHLFEPFSQVEFGWNRRFEGVGNGLALVKRFAELNGASVSATSERGNGSVFRMHFPQQIEVSDRRRAAPALAGTGPLGDPLRLFPVDDSPIAPKLGAGAPFIPKLIAPELPTLEMREMRDV